MKSQYYVNYLGKISVTDVRFEKKETLLSSSKALPYNGC